MKLKMLLQRLALQNREDFPFPDSLEDYAEDFVPNILMKSESLQQAFGVEDQEMEELYNEAYAYYQRDQYSESLTLFRWLTLLNAYQKKYWMGFAANQLILNSYEKALQAYAVAALLDYRDPYPHYYAYESYLRLNNREEGEKALQLAYHRCGEKPEYQELKISIEQILNRGSTCHSLCN